MKRSNRVKWGEIRVGLLILIAIIALVWASFTGGGTSIFENKVSYVSYFNNVNGLVSGAPVWLSGVEVGNVTSVKFVNLDSLRQIELKFRVVESVIHMITSDAKVELGTIGLLGDKYLEIIPGTLTYPMLEPGSVVGTEYTSGFDAIMKDGQGIMSSTKGMFENLDELTQRIKAGEGTMGRLFSEDDLYLEMTKLMASMNVLMEGLQKNQERLVASIENVSYNLDSITSRVENNSGTIGKLIGDPSLFNNLNSSTGRIDSILAKINNGEGTAGAVVNDEELYQDIKNLVGRIDNLVADIEKNPRKYFKFSVF